MPNETQKAKTDRQTPPSDKQGRVELTAEMARDNPDHQAEIVRQLLVPGVLHNMVNLDIVSTPGLKVYVDQLLEEARASDDPIERMMVEQLAMAHVRLARLHDRTTRSGDLAETEACDKAAARLLGEFRRLALALQQYRGQAQSRSTTVIHRVEQANIAADQEIGYAKAGGEQDGERVVQMHSRDTEMAGRTPDGERDDAGGRIHAAAEEPAPSRCGSA